MSYDFNKALNQKSGTITRAPTLPRGTYVCYIADLFNKVVDRKTRNGDSMTIFEFPVRVVEPREVVDPEELKKFGDVTKAAPMKMSFLLIEGNDSGNQNTMYRLDQFLAEHLQAAGSSLLEKMNNSKGCRFLAEVVWRADSNDPEVNYAEIKRTAPLG